MSQLLRDVAYQLNYNLDRFNRLDWNEDIYLENLEADYGEIYKTEPLNIPNSLVYLGGLVFLQYIDYPYPLQDYGVMSKRMLEVLLSVKPFPHQILPVVIKDWVEQSGDVANIPDNDDFVGVQLTEYVNVFDYKHSVYTKQTYTEPRYNEITREEEWFVTDVEEFRFLMPQEGLPPIFRIKESPVDLFISDEARQALKKAGITGTRYVSLRGYRHGQISDETDVPVYVPNPQEQLQLEGKLRHIS